MILVGYKKLGLKAHDERNSGTGVSEHIDASTMNIQMWCFPLGPYVLITYENLKTKTM